VGWGGRFACMQRTRSAGHDLADWHRALYDASKEPRLIEPFCLNNANPCSANNGLNRRGRNPVTGELLPAVKIGTFAAGSGAPFQGMRVVKESALNSPGIEFGPRVGFAYDISGD